MQTTRRAFTMSLAGVLAACTTGAGRGGLGRRPEEAALPFAANAGFDAWVAAFRSRAAARGIAPRTLDAAFRNAGFIPGVVARDRSQTEFTRTLDDYLAIAASDERVAKGRAALAERGATLAAIAARYGVEPHVVAAVWGLESFFGERRGTVPVISALSTLAYDGRRGAFFESQLIAALRILENGDITPDAMTGSWAGAMGHTQWMPEVWLNVGIDYDRDGKVSPFGKPDDALGSSAKYLLNRGKYRRGEHWGYEVRGASGGSGGSRTYAAWTSAGVTRADGQPFPQPNASAQLWVPVAGGPAFLLGPNFYSVKSYNPSMNYALAICHLGDRILGGPTFIQPFPGSEIRFSSGIRTSLRNTSLKLAPPDICLIGRTATPGSFIDRKNMVRPACLGTLGWVRVMMMP